MNEEVQRYLSSVPEGRQPLVNQLHTLILNLYPDATIDMSYRMPTYKVKDGWVALCDGELEKGLLYVRDIGAIRSLQSPDGPATRPPLQALGSTE